jgi:hypothetical protein
VVAIAIVVVMPAGINTITVLTGQVDPVEGEGGALPQHWR